jgi:AmmeMemoRadiSam system protein B
MLTFDSVMSQPHVRRAAVAGSWYPGTAAALAAELDRYCARVTERVDGDVRAVIAPHAGLVYSGPVAAHAYAQLRGRQYDVVVLVGPSHHVAFNGVAVWPRGSFDTPLGPVAIAEDVADALMGATATVRDRPDAHVREHSVEMQIPFIRHLLPGVPIVPLVMGHQSPGNSRALADALARVLAGRRALLVASSDLSHYHPATQAAALDGIVADAIRAFDADVLESAMARCPEHACGGGPMAAVMRASRELGARDARVLCYQDSGDVSGDKHAVVGYVAAVLGTFAVTP